LGGGLWKNRPGDGPGEGPAWHPRRLEGASNEQHSCARIRTRNSPAPAKAHGTNGTHGTTGFQRKPVAEQRAAPSRGRAFDAQRAFLFERRVADERDRPAAGEHAGRRRIRDRSGDPGAPERAGTGTGAARAGCNETGATGPMDLTGCRGDDGHVHEGRLAGRGAIRADHWRAAGGSGRGRGPDRRLRASVHRRVWGNGRRFVGTGETGRRHSRGGTVEQAGGDAAVPSFLRMASAILLARPGRHGDSANLPGTQPCGARPGL
jgi:hypothetical protein